MSRKRSVAALLTVAVALTASPTRAWGPDTQVAIVSAATHLLGRDSAFSLDQMLRYVVQGASIDADRQRTMYPAFLLDPVSAIQREMILLQTMRGNRIDPYYAYRLGSLGKLVAQATAPLAASESVAVRAQYYADVERSIGRTNLRMAQRKIVDPRAYFALVRSEAAKNDQTIIVDYKGGVGFRGFAQPALSIDASRSVNAVADVWYTILTAQLVAFDEPSEAKRDYILGAIDFYLETGNLEEVRAAYDRAAELRLMDNDLRKSIGDRYFDAGLYDRAIVEYQQILASDPSRRDVIERVAEYYDQAGDDAKSKNKLEDAREAYAKAVEANSLRTEAQRKLLEVDEMIYKRDERLLVQRSATEEAREFENRAEESVTQRDYARAITLLREAETRYASVTDEFPEEAKVASIGLRNVTLRLKELKQELIGNSQSLSGSGYVYDVRRIAAQTPDNSVDALKGMVRSEYDGAVRALSTQLAPE